MSALVYFQAVDLAVVAAFGQSVQYSRPAGPSFDAVDPFALSVIVDTGGKYADPQGDYAAILFVPAAGTAIPLGPQKGDLIEITPGFSGLSAGSYFVQMVRQDSVEGAAQLAIRWTGN